VNVDISPFLTYVRGEQGFFASATIFALSATNGEYLSVQALIDNKVVGNVSISALTNNKNTAKLENAVYCVCPSDNFIINCYEHLNNIGICFILNDDKQAGTYILTVEFDNKLQLHLIELEGGNYIFWPSDKIIWIIE
jgi:hypothetical protein